MLLCARHYWAQGHLQADSAHRGFVEGNPPETLLLHGSRCWDVRQQGHGRRGGGGGGGGRGVGARGGSLVDGNVGDGTSKLQMEVCRAGLEC